MCCKSAVPPPPHRVEAKAESGTTVSVQWRRPAKPNGNIIGYTVFYIDSKRYGQVPMDPGSTVPHNITRALLTSLKPFTEYTLKVRIRTHGGEADSDLVRVTTDAAGEYRSTNPFTPKTDQCQISPAASPEVLHHTVMENFAFQSLLRWKMIIHVLTNLATSLIHFLFKRLGECT